MNERGQASIEMLGALPTLLLAAMVSLQLLAAGYALILADGAAEAGALAVAAGKRGEDAVWAALPGWARDRVEIEVEGGQVGVELRPPTVVPGLERELELSSTAHVRPPR